MTDLRPASTAYQVCTRCVMDTSAANIAFDQEGKCNYCIDFLDKPRQKSLSSPTSHVDLTTLIDRVKANGKNKAYDCIIGVSGGVDSSWALVKAVELGLRPLAVHMDNGWDSELAQNNIANLVTSLGVDLFTHVIEWDEYRGLMQAFFDADVIDVELLYDNAMLAVNYNAARKYRLRYILSGSNHATEGMAMPREWNWYKFDKRNIQAVAKAHGGPKLDSFPAIGTLRRFQHRVLHRIEWVTFLDLLNYNKEDALTHLERHFGYKRYPYKHYESIFTRFYQGYLLPEKFGIDKRRTHLSTLVASGQMSRFEAISHFTKSPYPDDKALETDLDFFLKKMRWTQQDLETYLRRTRVEHSVYPSELWMHSGLRNLIALTRLRG